MLVFNSCPCMRESNIWEWWHLSFHFSNMEWKITDLEVVSWSWSQNQVKQLIFNVIEEEESAASTGMQRGRQHRVSLHCHQKSQFPCVRAEQTRCNVSDVVRGGLAEKLYLYWGAGKLSVSFGHRPDVNPDLRSLTAVSKLLITANSTQAHFSQPFPLFLLRLFQCLWRQSHGHVTSTTKHILLFPLN